jgi:hypothetical protein
MRTSNKNFNETLTNQIVGLQKGFLTFTSQLKTNINI